MQAALPRRASPAPGRFHALHLDQFDRKYRAQHNGVLPTDLNKLIIKTDEAGAAGGTLGPYMVQIPDENITGTNAVAVTTDDPIAVTGTTGGWIYSSTSGELRINHSAYDTE